MIEPQGSISITVESGQSSSAGQVPQKRKRDDEAQEMAEEIGEEDAAKRSRMEGQQAEPMHLGGWGENFQTLKEIHNWLNC